MRPQLRLAVPWIVLLPSVLIASDFYFNYAVSVDVGSLCRVGDVVHWQLAATIGGPSRGIASFGVSLIESRGERMEILPTAKVPTWIYPTVFVSNFVFPEHKVYGYFTYKNYFMASGGGGAGHVGM